MTALAGFGLSLAAAAGALVVAPPTIGVLVDASGANLWISGPKVVESFDLEVWTDTAAIAMTLGEIFAGAQNVKAIGTQDMTSAAAATDLVTKIGHGLLTGDGPFFLTTAGTLPGGTALGVPYYAIVISSSTFKLAPTLFDALAGNAIDLTTDAVGTLTIIGPAALRVYWRTLGKLGPAGDGAVALGASKAYLKTFTHSMRTIAYAVSATLDTGAVSIAAWPRRN